MRGHVAGVLVVAWLAGGCAELSTEGALTLRAPGETRALEIYPDGGVVSASFQLKATREGYWGVMGDTTVDLNADGRRIFGIIGNDPINMRLRVEGDGLRTQGQYGSRIGRLSADGQAISSYLGTCRYDLHLVGARFEGTRSCFYGRNGEPVTIVLPPRFVGLSAERRAMLLTLLLGGASFRLLANTN
jgi:hypothetical protein